MRIRPLLVPLLLAGSSLLACTAASSGDDGVSGDEAITSHEANILDFQFQAEVVGEGDADARRTIVSQLMYVQGMLTTAAKGNAHVGNVKLSDVVESAEGGKKRITYKASLPVAWPKDQPRVATYDLPLPLDTTRLDAFNEKYDGKCGRNAYGLDSFWHDWNPGQEGCAIDDADVSRAKATLTPHPKETKNQYPEYAEIWRDERLDVVAIFGIISSDTPGDWGYIEAGRFLDASSALLTGADLRENAKSSSILKDQTLTGKVTIGGRLRDVKVDVLVVHELQSVGSDFEARYAPLSAAADMVLYNGHAGLGKNVNALARKGTVTPGKYQLMLLNGCQTFAYIDTTIFDRRREANGAAADPDGTRFLDVVGNALPGYANNLADMSAALVTAAAKADQPTHYNALLEGMPASHIVVVFGEEDNVFRP
jgi:hypothetical protein